ncbi:uncharacterized protein N7483_011628 [Penicillium malachiteum]|uniref:uncharacterized protein n=1 Tax=Penicillium malachiteum TaxID=1324776 RepID=UPI0025482989|nr:uncharacterized protein N7483_011628 [Penicillium malachiteum]KAJ5714447.1 hypothetical protein N7483_011628 [Penicillium malachiteum]
MPAVCMGDGPEGVGNNLNNVTTFPAPVMSTAAWNMSLATRFGEALAQEHKAKRRNVVLAPNINIVRTPLWTRAAESLSEDPYLNSLVGVAIAKGIQSQDMIACPKHLAAYNQDTNRFGVARNLMPSMPLWMNARCRKSTCKPSGQQSRKVKPTL